MHCTLSQGSQYDPPPSVCPPKAGKDRHSMSKQIDKSLFIASSMPRFYQQLLSGIGSYQELGNRIIKQIKVACAFRQVERVRELSELLIGFPIKEYQLIGHYYIVWCDGRESKYNTKLLEGIIEQTTAYKTKAMLSLAAFEGYQGRIEASIYFYTKALKTSPSVSDYIILIRSIAALKSVEGFHELALRDLENLLPIIKHSEPLVYYDFLNSYAVELGEAGRKDEARNIIKHVVASPFAFVYPEWQETAQELKEPNRAFISVSSIEPDPVEIEVHEKIVSIQAHKTIEPEQPASVISFPQLREAPRPEQPKLLKSQELEYMNLAEKREFIMAAIKSGRIPESEYKKMIYLLGLVESGPANQIIDLEDAALLNNIIMRWCNLIEPEQFAAVMSALRDCKEDWRRKTIMDDMIAIAYQQTSSNINSEREWREKVECRLPEK
jgi:tetratricopeptide (TPR) repeat protein